MMRVEGREGYIQRLTHGRRTYLRPLPPLVVFLVFLAVFVLVTVLLCFLVLLAVFWLPWRWGSPSCLLRGRGRGGVASLLVPFL